MGAWDPLRQQRHLLRRWFCCCGVGPSALSFDAPQSANSTKSHFAYRFSMRRRLIFFNQWIFGLLKRVTVQLSDALHKRAKHYAVDNDVSMNELFNAAIEKYLDDARDSQKKS